MSLDDTHPPPPPRFVPTLTEVVSTDDALESAPPRPPASSEPVASTPAPAPFNAAERATAVADDLLARLGPDLDRLIGEAIGRVLHEQMLGFNGRVQKAVAEVVREAVAKSLMQGDPTSPPRSLRGRNLSS